MFVKKTLKNLLYNTKQQFNIMIFKNLIHD
mgnify:CR=1 FL=1